MRIFESIAENHHSTVRELIKSFFGTKLVTGLEIGTGCAGLTKQILAVPNVSKLYSVDPYVHDPTSQFEASLPQDQLDAWKQASEELMIKDNRLEMLYMKSDQAFEKLRGERLDFIWLDGDLREEQVRKDIENAFGCVRSPSFLGGHDYHLVKGVTRAVDSLLGSFYYGNDYTYWRFI